MIIDTARSVVDLGGIKMRKPTIFVTLMLVVVMMFTVLTGCERPDSIPDPAEEIQVEESSGE